MKTRLFLETSFGKRILGKIKDELINHYLLLLAVYGKFSQNY